MDRPRSQWMGVVGRVGVLLVALALVGWARGAWALERVSVGSGGTQGNGGSGVPVPSGDGRLVVFTSQANNLVPSPAVTIPQTYLRNRVTGETILVSLGLAGHEANNGGFAGFVRSSLGLSADGRYLAYDSMSTNLVASPALSPGQDNVYLWDRTTGATSLVSQGAGGASPDGSSGIGGAAISADGNVVAFESEATNLVSDGGSGTLYVHLRTSGETRRIPVVGDVPSLNGDGTLLAYRGANAIVRNLTTDAETTVNVDRHGVPVPDVPGGPCAPSSAQHGPKISADGRTVAFVSRASGLVDTPGITAGRSHAYVRRLDTLVTELVDVAVDGTEGNGGLAFGPLAISADGRFVAFATTATNLLDPTALPPTSPPGCAPPRSQVFVRDLVAGVTRLVSATLDGTPGNGSSSWPALSGDGQTVALQSAATNLVPSDTNGAGDVFAAGTPALVVRNRAAFNEASRPLPLTRIDFDHDACKRPIVPPSGGRLAGDLYRPLGVRFQAGVILPYPPGAPVAVSLPNELTNTAINTPTPSGALAAGSFARAVQALAIQNVGAGAVLRVFDEADDLLTEAATDGDGTTADFVGVVSPTPIARFEYTFASGLGFGGDDLLFSQIMSADCVAPVLHLPGLVVADASSPAGAVVVFEATATDKVDPQPLVSCKPASGSLFPLGATQVACTAEDAAGNVATGQFAVLVGATNGLAALLKTVQALGLPDGLTRSLEAKLEAALKALRAARLGAACGPLGGFQAAVQALEGAGQLGPAAAKALIGAADQLDAMLGCP